MCSKVKGQVHCCLCFIEWCHVLLPIAVIMFGRFTRSGHPDIFNLRPTYTRPLNLKNCVLLFILRKLLFCGLLKLFCLIKIFVLDVPVILTSSL